MWQLRLHIDRRGNASVAGSQNSSEFPDDRQSREDKDSNEETSPGEKGLHEWNVGYSIVAAFSITKGERMKTKHVVMSLLAVTIAGIMAACGGSSGGAAATTTATGTGTATDTATKSISAVSVDPTTLDASQQTTSADVSATKSVLKTESGIFGTTPGVDKPRSACELYQLKKEAIRAGKSTDGIICMFGAAQAADSNFVIDSTPRYYRFNSDVSAGAKSGKMRGVLRVSKTDGTLRADICKGATPALMNVLTVGPDSTDPTNTKKVHASGYQHFKAESGELGEDAAIDDTGSFDLSVTLKDATAAVSSYSNISAGTLVATMHGIFGDGHLTFSKSIDDAGTDINTLSGVYEAVFGTGNDFTSQITGEMDKTQGTAKFAVTGTFPAFKASELLTGNATQIMIALGITADTKLCPTPDAVSGSCHPTENFTTGACKHPAAPTLDCMCLKQADTCTFTSSGQQSFTVSTDSEGVQSFLYATTSPYADAVTATDLPSATFDLPAAPSDAWDCSIPEGKTVVTIDMSKADLTACGNKIKKGFDNSERHSCQSEDTSSGTQDAGSKLGND